MKIGRASCREREEVQAAQRHRPNLIVLDVMLPDMDGFEVIRRLRGGGDRIPVVFLTARDATEDKIFFFSSRRRHTRYWRDWSSDVCSSDLGPQVLGADLKCSESKALAGPDAARRD